MTERDILASNTAKEKELRRNILGQVEGTYDNMAHRNALNAKYPNFKATGSLWNVYYVPLAAGTDMLAGNGAGNKIPMGDTFTEFDAIKTKYPKMSDADILRFIGTHSDKNKSTFDPKSGMKTKEGLVLFSLISTIIDSIAIFCQNCTIDYSRCAFKNKNDGYIS